jgi:superfamily II DNA helicase RecQ
VGALPRGFQLRTAQAHHMHALAGGGDFLGVAATAAGKSLCLFVASAAEALARRRREGEAPRQLTPVQLIVVPFANLGPSLQDWGNQFYHQVAASHFPGWECERYFPRVLYAERTYGAPGASDDATPAGRAPRASGTCPKGHMLCFFADSHSARDVARRAWCNVCGRDLKRGDRRGNCAACDWDVCMLCAPDEEPQRGAGASASDDPAPVVSLPTSIPCGVCAACSERNEAKRQKFLDGCSGCCRVWLGTSRRADWCDMCGPKKASYYRCTRRASLARGTPGESLSLGGVGAEGADGSAGAMEAATRPGGDHGSRRRPPAELLASYIQQGFLHRPEVAIAEDSTVVVVVATVSALASRTEDGELLNYVIARRGVSRLLFDEVHCLWQDSTASYSESLAGFGGWFDRTFAMLRRNGHPRPQIAGFTSTLPPRAKVSVERTLRMAVGSPCIRCTIDRPELRFVRLLLPQSGGCKEAYWIQLVLDRLHRDAPEWALRGKVVVYCSSARVAKRAFIDVRVRRPDGSGGMRPNVLFRGVTKDSTAARADAMRRFGADPHALLFTNEAWSHGSGTKGIGMVVHCALPLGPVELWQRSGRAAREAGEEGLVVFVISCRMLVQRFLLADSEHSDAAVGARLLLRQLAATDCARSQILHYLGDTGNSRPCAGCDRCLRWLGSLVRGIRSVDAAIFYKNDVERSAVTTVLEGLPSVASYVAPTLSQLLARPSALLQPPFSESSNYDLLVWHLLAENSIQFQLFPVPGRPTASLARCYADPNALAAYRVGGRRLSVLLPVGWYHKDESSECSSDSEVSALPPVATHTSCSSHPLSTRLHGGRVAGAVADKAIEVAHSTRLLLRESLDYAMRARDLLTSLPPDQLWDVMDRLQPSAQDTQLLDAAENGSTGSRTVGMCASECGPSSLPAGATPSARVCSESPSTAVSVTWEAGSRETGLLCGTGGGADLAQTLFDDGEHDVWELPNADDEACERDAMSW